MKTKIFLSFVLFLLSFSVSAQQKYKDALLFDLKGNVKYLENVYRQESDVVGYLDFSSDMQFKNNGERICGNDDTRIGLKRDSQGRITYEKYVYDSTLKSGLTLN